MEKRAKGRVFQERTNIASKTLSFLDDTPIFLNQHQRTVHDTGLMMPLKPPVSEHHCLASPSEPSDSASSNDDVHTETDEEIPLKVRSLHAAFASRPATTDSVPARFGRYLKAEQALAETVHFYLEHTNSAQDLQIEALRRALSTFNAHVVDAKDQVENLRALLANRQTDPHVYRSMQRQRWMEERRQQTAEQLLKGLEEQLAKLTSQPTPLVSTYLDDTSNAKSNASRNLEIFFDSSWQRTPVRSRVRRRVITPSRPRQEKSYFPRTHHHRHLLSLKLRTPEIQHSFLKPQKPSDDSHSGTNTTSTNVNTEIPPAVTHLAPLPLSLISPLPTISEGPDTDRCSIPDGSGTATIWYSQPSGTNINLSDLVVSMPDYVSDLLSGFAADTSLKSSDSLSVHLPPPQALSTSASPARLLGTSKSQVHLPSYPTLRRSRSRRRLSNIISLPEVLSSRMASSEGLTHVSRERLSTPPHLSLSLRNQVIDETISEDVVSVATSTTSPPSTAGRQLGTTRISFSANHLPDVTRSSVEDSIPSSSSHVGIGGGNMKVVARLRRRISGLRNKS